MATPISQKDTPASISDWSVFYWLEYLQWLRLGLGVMVRFRGEGLGFGLFCDALEGSHYRSVQLSCMQPGQSQTE